jgi:hypothetical protein
MCCHLLLSAVLLPPEQAPAPHEKVVYYFPVTVGAKWVYICDNDRGLGYTRVVTSVKDGKNGAKIVIVDELSLSGKETRVIEVSNQGLFALDEKAPEKKFCLLKLPHKNGQTWDEVGGITFFTVDLTAYGPEKRTVPAGTFECIRVKSILRDYTMYAPGIGMVESYGAGAGVHLVLKSFSPGKE